MEATVYFTNLKALSGRSLIDKVGLLFDRAGLAQAITPGDLTAVKLHFGERGNTAYLRPQYTRKVVDKIKKAGGKPFLTDANTLYVGSRSNAVDHTITALENGFAFATMGAPVVIADGLTGHDYVPVEINRKHFQEAKVASAIYHADSLIAVTHFKCHEATGIGGVLKNLGMGSGSRAAKQAMHSDIIPSISREKCIACGRCTRWCPAGAIRVDDYAVIDQEKCLGCGECTITCNQAAIEISWKGTPDMVQERIVEYADAVLRNKQGKAGYLSFLIDITPQCDCTNYNNVPVVEDIGILAGTDPVAMDQAAVDLVNSRPSLHGCGMELPAGADKFRAIYPKIDWSVQLAYGERLGLGSRNYRLVEI